MILIVKIKTQNQMTIKWIQAHVGLERNNRADSLSKDVAKNDTP
jgi:ribonuclease HI